ncbi:MAG: hypothetical protein LUG44_06160, partial [Clostridiales bacterium]|nr:hypothetical protein [Clostridiales bacterium]
MNATASKPNTSRDISLDYLKCIALLGLVIAHVSTNEVLLQIRSFDVNLLVIISAILGYKRLELSDVENKLQYIGRYYIKRFCRLVLPTWIFVTFYFWLNSIFQFQELTETKIIRTYLLQDASIGYVWIIYIYLICALMMPLLVRIDLRKFPHVAICVLLFCLYLVIKDTSDNYYIRIFVLYPIIYGLISVIGVNFREVSLRVWTAMGIFCLTVFTVIAFRLWQETGGFVYTGAIY